MAKMQALFYAQLKEKFGMETADRIEITMDDRKVITLEGKTETWQQVVDIGHLAGKLPGIKGVVNRIHSDDEAKESPDRTKDIEKGRKKDASENGIFSSLAVVSVVVELPEPFPGIIKRFWL